MINSDTEINQLPFDIEVQLHRSGDYYICSKFTEGFVGPRVAIIEGNVHYRFLNFLYLPQPPESLTNKQVIDICDLRLEYFDELVNVKINREVVAFIANKAKSKFLKPDLSIKALDFGCGSGLSSQLLLDYIPNLGIEGIDISEKAVQASHQKGLTATHTIPNKPLPFNPGTFDIIFAIFVMHFNVDMSTLVELHRILRKSGSFVFNVYMRDIEGVIQQLQKVGFRRFDIWDISNLIENHIIENHWIVICNAQQSYKVVFN